MRVLIADGDEAFLESAERFLSDHGHEARIATNGLGSIFILSRYVPDVVVLERELLWGGSDGVRAFMLQVPSLSKIPVILTSDDVVLVDSVHTTGLPLAAQFQKPHCLEGVLDYLQARSVDSTVNLA